MKKSCFLIHLFFTVYAHSNTQLKDYSLDIPTHTCFVTTHGNSANHFAACIPVLNANKIVPSVFTTIQHTPKFGGSKLILNSIPNPSHIDEGKLTELIASVSTFTFAFFDCAEPLWEDVINGVRALNTGTTIVVYRDNWEQTVPGHYEDRFRKSASIADIVLFGNPAHVESIVIPGVKPAALGYYPFKEAEVIETLRKSPEATTSVKAEMGIHPEEKVLLYVGSHNPDYYEGALPHFLSLVAKMESETPGTLENTVVVLQQHPAAKKQNKDVKTMKGKN